MVEAINAIFVDCEGYVPLTAFSVDKKIFQYCKSLAHDKLQGEVFIKKLAYNNIDRSIMNWDI